MPNTSQFRSFIFDAEFLHCEDKSLVLDALQQFSLTREDLYEVVLISL